MNEHWRTIRKLAKYLQGLVIKWQRSMNLSPCRARTKTDTQEVGSPGGKSPIPDIKKSRSKSNPLYTNRLARKLKQMEISDEASTTNETPKKPRDEPPRRTQSHDTTHQPESLNSYDTNYQPANRKPRKTDHRPASRPRTRDEDPPEDDQFQASHFDKYNEVTFEPGYEDIDHKTIDKITEYCHQCQMHEKSLGWFKFTLKDDDTGFNHTIYVDVMYINNKPALHVVDKATSYQAARFMKNMTSRETWDRLRSMWMDSYLGPPDNIIRCRKEFSRSTPGAAITEAI
ncbi:hypothetical protein F5Y04DRAFT_291050 [Hypomontagnella monticulosa]|nr:hypothetical protein F5Y04DRAFT_291050 [Hypomontagnella monticulosa]